MNGFFPGHKNENPYVKDGINDFIVYGNQNAVNPEKQGTKAAAHYQVNYRRRSNFSYPPAAYQKNFRTQMKNHSEIDLKKFLLTGFVKQMNFTRSVTPPSVDEDKANVMRQALAGMLWSKQYFFFDGDNWLDEHNSNPLHTGYKNSRNSEWYPYVERGHYFHARQMGISLVCCMGPGIPYTSTFHCGS